MPEIPSYDEIKKIILTEKDEKWLQKKVQEFEAIFEMDDPAMKLWMIAKQNHIEVPDIRADDRTQEGKPLSMGEFTSRRCQEEMAKDQEDRDLFCVEGIVSGLTFDETSPQEEGKQPKARVKFTLTDKTGRGPVTGWGDQTVSLVTQARIKDGDYVRIPLVNMFGRFMDKAETNFWRTLSLPPFGKIEKVKDKSFRDVYANPETDAIEDGTPIYLEGFATVIDPRENPTCSVCNRWIIDKKPEQHKKCGEYDIIKKTAYTGTIALRNASTYKFDIGDWMPKPEFRPAIDVVRLYGTWNAQYSTMRVQGWEVLKGFSAPSTPKKEAPKAPSQQKSSPKPTPPSSAPAKKAAPPPEPEPEDEEEEDVEEQGEALGTLIFDPKVVATIPDTLPRPKNLDQLKEVDFRNLQSIAKHFGINARQKQPVLVEELQKKLLGNVAAPSAAVVEEEEEGEEEEVAPSPPPKKAPTPKSAPPPPTVPGSIGAIRDGVLSLLGEMGPQEPSTLVEGVETMLEVERKKVDFAIGMLKTSGKIVLVGGKYQLAASDDGEAEEEPAPAPTKAKTPPPSKKATAPSASTPASTGDEEEIPEAVMTHFQDFIRDFGGANRTAVVVNNAIPEDFIRVSEADIKRHGDEEEAKRQKIIDYLDLGVQQGVLQWVGDWKKDGDRRIPPKDVKWTGDA